MNSAGAVPRDVVYSFQAQWFDPHAQLIRQFHIRYFEQSHQVEIIDTKTNRLFLKKTSCPPAINKSEFYIGSKVLLYGRNYELTDYVDSFTREKLGSSQQKSVAWILPNAIANAGKIIEALGRSNLTIASLKMLQLSTEDARTLYEAHAKESYFSNFIQPVTTSPVIAIEVVGDGSVEKLKSLAGPLCARYGTSNNDDIQPVFQCSDSVSEASKQQALFFQKPREKTAVLENCTCVVIQPHIVKDGKIGQVLDTIQAKFNVTAMEMFSLDRASAAEFLEVYEGVVPHYNDAVEQLTTGACVALEVSSRSESGIHSNFREAAGPWDIEMAKELRPSSIRAKFGLDRVKNGIHCTDLAEDAVLECQYFFEILSRR